MSADHQGGEHEHKHYGQLSLLVAGSPLRTYWLTQPRTTIGRRATNILVLDDLTVSGEHAMLLVGQQDVVIQDLGSRNGTLLNGRPIARALLDDGDCIDIGIYRLVYSRHGQPEQGMHAGVPGGQSTPSPWGAPGDSGVASPDASGPGAFSPDTPGPNASGTPGPAGSWNIPVGYGADRGTPFGNQSGSSAGGAASAPTPPPNRPISGFPKLTLGDPDLLRRLTADFPSLHPQTPVPSDTPPGGPAAGDSSGTPSPGASSPAVSSPAAPSPDAGFIEGFTRAPRIEPGPAPTPLPPVPPPMPRRRPPLNNGAGYRGASLRFLGGHDAGRLLVIDRPIVSIRNGCGQVAVVSSRADGFFLTHVEGQAYPLINGESIGLGAHPLRNHDLIELSGTIIQFSQSVPGGS